MTLSLAGCLAVSAHDVEIRYEVLMHLRMGPTTLEAAKVWSMSADRPNTGHVPLEFSSRGEAVRFVDANGRAIYGLRRTVTGAPSPANGAYPIECADGETFDDVLRQLRDFSGPCVLPSTVRPKLVMFGDEADPSSLIELPVEPDTPECRYYCLRVTVTRVQADITRGIEQHLPWLKLGSIGARIGSGDELGSTLGGTPTEYFNADFTTELWSRS